MTYERLVAMNVTDEKSYETYREKMRPILAKYGGGFRYDFTIARVLQSEAAHPVNRVFILYCRDKKAMEDFFADPEYKAVRAAYFEGAVQGATAIALYERA